MRARAVAKKAPAEPTTARTAVGFSGEVRQPVCACSGRAMKSRRAKPRNVRVNLFIDGLQAEGIDTVEKVSTQKVICQYRKSCFGCTILCGKRKGCVLCILDF
jgi:hypothetical protein